MRIMASVSLSDNQKRVLAKIAAAPTPKIAGEEISGDQNLVAARDQLGKLGAIEFVGGEATITDAGQQLAQDENIVDDSGQLTPDGEALAHTDASGEADAESSSAPQTPPMGLTMSHVPQYEPLRLLREMLKENFAFDVDHMSGPRVKHQSTNCKVCHGRKVLYKTPDGKVHADNKRGAKKLTCPSCVGSGSK